MHIAWSYFATVCTIKYHNTWLIVCQNACILVIPVRQLLQHFVLLKLAQPNIKTVYFQGAQNSLIPKIQILNNQSTLLNQTTFVKNVIKSKTDIPSWVPDSFRLFFLSYVWDSATWMNTCSLEVASIVHSAGVLAAPKLLNIILLNAPCKADLEKIYLEYYIIIPMIRVIQQFWTLYYKVLT